MYMYLRKNKCRHLLQTGFLLLGMTALAQDKKQMNELRSIDPAPFADAAHHWYDLADKNNIINPRPAQLRHNNTDLEQIADNILLYQRNNGGWPKNYDMWAVLNPAQKDSLLKTKAVLNTTFDNGTSYTHVAVLSQVYTATGMVKYKEAALLGISFILSAQYANGGWPQYFPLENNYSRHITFNDGAFEGIMSLLKDILDEKLQYRFIDSPTVQRVRTAFEKGIDCIVKTQINDNGKLTAWCQQYDETTLEPAWARKFEPPGICNGESSDLVLFLMSINHPSQQIIDAIQNAVAWFDASKILNKRVRTVAAPPLQTPYKVSTTDRVVENDPGAPPIWTRYYELKTHRPLFCNRDSKVVYSLAEVDRERRDGYAWYTYAPQKVLDRYGSWQKKWAPEKNVLPSNP